MAALVRVGFNLAKNAVFSTSVRAVSTTKALNIKQIHEVKEGSSLVVEGSYLPSPRTELLVRANVQDLAEPEEKHEKACYMCALGLEVKHTDVLILSQFVRSDGCMLPRRITGLCRYQQKKIGKMVSMAQKAVSGASSNIARKASGIIIGGRSADFEHNLVLLNKNTRYCLHVCTESGEMGIQPSRDKCLMINLTPHWCKKDPTKRQNWKKFNTYFDEKTIFWKKIPRPTDRFKRQKVNDFSKFI